MNSKVSKKVKDLTVHDFYFIKIGNMWRYMKTQHFSFWMICFYIFFEYSRPQSIFPVIDILPWAQVFLLMSLVGAILDPSVRWVSHPVNLLMNSFAVLVYLSSIFAYEPDVSKEYYINFFGWFVIYYLIIFIVNNWERFYIFLLVIILSSAKIAIGTSITWAARGFSFTKWGLMGPPGYFENSGELTILMLTLFPISYYLYEHLKKRVGKFERILLIIFWVTPVLTILGASSRASQLALFIQLLVMFSKKLFRTKQLIYIGVIAILIYSLLPEEQKERFNRAGEDSTSIQRLQYWKRGYEMIVDHPFLGVGFFNFPVYFEDHYPSDLVSRSHAQLPHNILIQIGTDAGVLALIIFLSLASYPIVKVIMLKKVVGSYGGLYNSLLRGLSVGLIGYYISGMFVSVAYYPFFWIGISLLVSLSNILKQKKESGKFPKNKRPNNAFFESQ